MASTPQLFFIALAVAHLLRSPLPAPNLPSLAQKEEAIKQRRTAFAATCRRDEN